MNIVLIYITILLDSIVICLGGLLNIWNLVINARPFLDSG